jgi:AMP-polyphosphate phosphotransferase
LQRERTHAVVVIATGLVAAGRTEALASLRDWLDPKRLTTHAWGPRDDAESQRPWAYRFWQAMPRKGEISIWFDGWYGDLFKLAMARCKDAVLEERARRITALENMLARDGVQLLKWHFDIGAAAQRKRVKKLRADELNRWRITDEDVRNCRRHTRVVRAHARCQSLTEHAGAPWSLIADAHEGKQSARLARELLDALQAPPESGVLAPLPRWQTPKSRAAAVTRLQSALEPAGGGDGEEELAQEQSKLALTLQSKRFRKRSLVVVLEGMDAAGKSSATKRVIVTMDPRQYRIVPIGAPTPEELAHPYLWRFWNGLPGRGQVSIFDRSWYGRVLVERVRGFAKPADWARAYAEIVEFERQLTAHRVIVAKFWFVLSKAEQGRRFEQRRSTPLKRFKVDPEDWENRKHWDEFQTAAADMLALTDWDEAPWTLLPADDKKAARLALVRGLNAQLDAAAGKH